jgi:hypothetical protein
MRWLGVAMMLCCGVAHADTQIATDSAPAQLATTGRCDRQHRLIGHEPGVVAGIMKARKLRPIKLERISLPNSVAVDAVAPNLLTTVRIGDRDVRGIYSNIAGDGCIYADIRHAVDADGNLYQIEGAPGVVDYERGRCHTARGWEPCNLRGVTNVLYVVPDTKAKLAGVIGSDLRFYPSTR